MRKKHLRIEEDYTEGFKALCDRSRYTDKILTDDESQVDCGNCLRILNPGQAIAEAEGERE